MIKNKIIELIGSSKESISISAWTIDSSHQVAKILLEKAKMGSKVTVFTRPHSSNMDFIKQLMSSGGVVYCHNLLHGKSLVVDDKVGLIMTANISKLGLDEGFETAVILNRQQTEVLNKIHKEWKTRATYVSSVQTKLKDVTKPWIDLNKELKVMEPPKPIIVKDRGKITVSNILDYFNKNLIVPGNNKSYDSILTKYKAILLPPKLPENAKKMDIKNSTNLEIYEVNKQRYVCIENKDQLTEAQELSGDLKAKIVFHM